MPTLIVVHGDIVHVDFRHRIVSYFAGSCSFAQWSTECPNLFGVLPIALDDREILVLRKVANLFPILLTGIGIDFDGPGIEAIAAPFLAAGDPIRLACLAVKIVSLEARASKRVESPTPE
jgi:hypothetical protein